MFDEFDEQDDVKTFRGRADHARLGAEETNSAELKDILLKLARLYDARADAVELVQQQRPGGPTSQIGE